MMRFGVALLVSLACSRVALADEPKPPRAMPSELPPRTDEDAIETAKRVEFDMLVLKGDQERAKGHIAEAATAYAQARVIHKDPLIGGRLGVLLVQLGKLEDAADLLADALHRDTEAKEDERLEFLRAYDKAKAEGAWIEVVISHVNTNLTLDGKPRNKNGYSSVFMFVLAGDHELRATLKGYKDAFASITVIKGERSRQVFLTLEELPDPSRHVEELRRKHSRVPVESAEDPPEDDAAEKRVVYGGVDGAQKPEKPRISVDAGPVVVFGVASWQPAVGAVAGVRWRPKDYFSLGVEGRAAWLTSGVGGWQISAMTVGGLASACGHWRWLFGCGIGHLGIINVKGAATSYEDTSLLFFKPGVGGRIGFKASLHRSLTVMGALDAIGLDARTRVIAGQTIVADQPAVMLGANLSGGWDF